MTLDQNLFTLNIVPQDENVTLLFDPMGTVYYRKERISGPIYTAHVIDPISDSTLASVTAPSATSKNKTIELHNPSVPIQLTFVGTLTFRWAFKWEEHEFEWRREECFLIRKPDPPVLVAITSTKDSSGRAKTLSVQILDYNLNRFDIEDRKGLEIVMLTALLSFQDAFEESHTKREDPVSPVPSSSSSNVSNIVVTPEDVRARTPKPKKTGVEQVAELQKGDLQDIVVYNDGEISDYAQYCANFLETDNMLFTTIQSSSAATVPKVLQVVQEIKRLRHKSGDDTELHQYVLYDTDLSIGADAKKVPRVIKLDDDNKTNKPYKPPQNLVVYLSKISMPELETQRKSGGIRSAAELDKTNATASGKEKSRRSRSKSPDASSSSFNVLSRKFKSSSHLRSDDAKSGKKSKQYQHMPSPSQLNNPSIYTTPPSLPPRDSNLLQPHSTSHPYPNSFFGPGPYPRSSRQQQRPVSSYDDQRPTSPSIVSGFLDKLKTW